MYMYMYMYMYILCILYEGEMCLLDRDCLGRRGRGVP